MQKSDTIQCFRVVAKSGGFRFCPDGMLKALPVLLVLLAITAISAQGQTVQTVQAAGQTAQAGQTVQTSDNAASQTRNTAVPVSGMAPSADAASQSRQSLTFGYISYDSVLRAMPAYATAMRQLDNLKAKYEAEAKRVESDFNKKYEEFLEGQRDFPQTILQKRQSELQELLDRNILFREESRRLLAEAERDLLAPLHARIGSLLRVIGEERGYAFIVNTDNNACPFINPSQGDNIGSIVVERLR